PDRPSRPRPAEPIDVGAGPRDGRVRWGPRRRTVEHLPLLLAVPGARERAGLVDRCAPAAVGEVRAGAGRLLPVPARAPPVGPPRRGLGSGPGRSRDPQG